MSTELIASGSTYAASADFTVTAGTPLALKIYATNYTGVVYDLYMKSSGAVYQKIFQLTPANIQDFGLIVAGGTYQVRRQAGSSNSSIESN